MEHLFWKDELSPSVNDEINSKSYKCVTDVLSEAVTSFSERPAFTSMGCSLSFSEVDRLSTAFAAFLQNETDLKPGDRVAVQLPNVLQSPVAVYGVLKAGMVLVNTNPLYTAHEMKEQFIDSGAKALVFMDLFGERVESIASEVPIKYFILTRFSDLFPQPKRALVQGIIKYVKRAVKPYSLPQAMSLREVIKKGEKVTLKPTSTTLDDVAVLQYTGGTTGAAKGAMLTHRNLIANMIQAKAFLSQRDEEGNTIVSMGKEVVIAALPIYHIYAFTIHLMAFTCIGANNILIANPKDIPGFVKLLRKTPFSGLIGLNTLFVALLHHPGFSSCSFSALKLTLSGGTALSASTANKWKEVTGCSISEGYGLTECAPAVCANLLGDLAQLGTVGLPVKSTELRVIDPETGGVLPAGKAGELCVKGPQVMKGYWNNPAATEEVLKDGWLHTGDIAEIRSDGFVCIVDRIKDMVLVSGFNVYPNEVEKVVSHHPDVLSCAVVGIPDEKTGEAIKLFVVPKHDNLTEKAIQLYCKEYLTAYKIPHYIEFRQQLPMTPVGKVLRRKLRDEHVSVS